MDEELAELPLNFIKLDSVESTEEYIDENITKTEQRCIYKIIHYLREVYLNGDDTKKALDEMKKKQEELNKNV